MKKNVSYTGPSPVNILQAKVLGPTSVQLNWQASPGASSYQVWRVENYPTNSLASVFNPISGSSLTDISLTPNVPYLYVLRAINGTDTSGFGTAIFARPHPLPKIDSLRAVDGRQLEIFFSEAVTDRQADKAKFKLNDTHVPISIIKTGDRGKRLLLSFAKGFVEGNNKLDIDSTFQDADLACLVPSSLSQQFVYENTEEESLILTHWEAASDKEAVLYF